jgi:hypothetical protein
MLSTDVLEAVHVDCAVTSVVVPSLCDAMKRYDADPPGATDAGPSIRTPVTLSVCGGAGGGGGGGGAGGDGPGGEPPQTARTAEAPRIASKR